MITPQAESHDFLTSAHSAGFSRVAPDSLGDRPRVAAGDFSNLKASNESTIEEDQAVGERRAKVRTCESAAWKTEHAIELHSYSYYNVHRLREFRSALLARGKTTSMTMTKQAAALAMVRVARKANEVLNTWSPGKRRVKDCGVL